MWSKNSARAELERSMIGLCRESDAVEMTSGEVDEEKGIGGKW